MKPLLDGVRVLDLTRALAGPLCTALLADLGADVVKVESIGGGDPARNWPPFDEDTSLYFAAVNRGKRSLALDLRTDEGLALLHRLIARSDVVVENFRPGVFETIVDPAELRERHPELILMSISGYGPVGPERTTPGLDQIAQGMSGLMSLTGAGEQTPMRMGVPIVDALAGIYAALGIAAGLASRRANGSGQHVQTSLLEAAISVTVFQAQRFLSLGEVAEPTGNDHPTITPYGMFRTADAPINIAVGSEAGWANLCEALGEPELARRPQYLTSRNRLRLREDVNQDIERLLSGRGAAEWIPLIRAAGVPCGPIHTMDQVFADPQVRALGMVQTVVDGDGKPVPLTRGPFWVDGTATPVKHAPPRTVGQNTEEILLEIGLTPEDVAGLRAGRVVGCGEVAG
ncbi:CoA transferase [Streptosporangium sp. KLBMP 9127]|nr:CoA transferase [Streptosporangium sp. KLBMP 9127]